MKYSLCAALIGAATVLSGCTTSGVADVPEETKASVMPEPRTDPFEVICEDEDGNECPEPPPPPPPPPVMAPAPPPPPPARDRGPLPGGGERVGTSDGTTSPDEE